MRRRKRNEKEKNEKEKSAAWHRGRTGSPQAFCEGEQKEI